MSGMAEVLAKHSVAGMSGGTHLACRCNRTWVPHAEYRAHLEEELVAAGFGPVKEAGAVALEEAAAELLSDESAPPKSIKEMYNAIYATWLQRRAAAVRGEA